MGAQQVIITLGSSGSIFNLGEELYQVPACQIEAVDTTAALQTDLPALLPYKAPPLHLLPLIHDLYLSLK